MLFAPPPIDESERLAALRALQVLDTPSEERFDRITRVAAALFEVPIALVSLVDQDRQWFKSRCGLGVTETPRNIAFCAHAILSKEILAVPETLLDERFRDNPLVVSDPGIRSYHGAPLQAANGQRVGTLCIIDTRPRQFDADQLARLRDLADIVEAELNAQTLIDISAQLTALSSHLESVLDTVAEGILTIDAEGLIASTNAAASQLFGATERALIGAQLERVLPHPHWENVLARIRRSLDDDASALDEPLDVEGRRTDGSTFPMELALGSIAGAERPLFTVVVRDITERKAVDRRKREFISTVSHELRTPLTSIRGALGLVRGRFAAGLSTKALKMLEMAERNSERLTLLVNDLLDLEKIEGDRLYFDLQPNDLNEMARCAIEDNDGYAQRHQVELELTTLEEPAPVLADRQRLLQVFANLISNAIKYSPPGERVSVRVESESAGFRVSVRDRGPGIPDSFRSRMFGRFEQADGSDQGKGGTGLGLAISKAIIERHGGSIGFETRTDAGTEFFFTLPRDKSPSVSAAPTSRHHALIIEANDEIAELLAGILETSEVTADRVTTATAARQMLGERGYDLILLDLANPATGEVALMKELKANAAFSKIPAIVVSGETGPSQPELSAEVLPIVDWLQKPIDRQRLEQALARVQEGTKEPSILHVEDDPDLVQLLQALLAKTALIDHAASLDQARQFIASRHYDLLLLDLGLADGSGADLIDDIPEGCQIVILSAQEAEAEVRQRVHAALTKSRISETQLVNIIKRALSSAG